MQGSSVDESIKKELAGLREAGLYKKEFVLSSPQSAQVEVPSDSGLSRVINFCANNYLGLADHPDIVNAATAAMKRFGYGTASVRFICGTMSVHKALEYEIASYLGYEDAITFAACFDANGALFEPLFGPEDAIISDSLNHASLIDGIRLCKARRLRYRNNNAEDLEAKLKLAHEMDARRIAVVTDGVFSMDGTIADLKTLSSVAKKHAALVIVDDCHATGVLGPAGEGTAAHLGLASGSVDIITGTFGKALGGGMGGFICASAPIIELLRQRARPYLFSNALAPALAAGAIIGIKLSRKSNQRRKALFDNARRFRTQMAANGFTLKGADHPIIPVMLGDARLAQLFASELFEAGIYAIGFFYPVVPKNEARIRIQLSALHDQAQIDRAVEAFTKIGRRHGVV